MKELKFRFLVWWHMFILGKTFWRIYRKKSWSTITGMRNQAYNYVIINTDTGNIVYQKSTTYVHYIGGRCSPKVVRRFNKNNL